MSLLTERLAAYGCNMEAAMGRFLDNEDFYATCYEKFVEDKSFAALGENLMSGNVRGAFEAAHDLKGISANMGITPVYDLIAELVEGLRTGNIPADAMTAYQRLISMRDELRGFVK